MALSGKLPLSIALAVGVLAAFSLALSGGGAQAARLAVPAAAPADPGDSLCVTLGGGGPYVGCGAVFTDVQAAVDAAGDGAVVKIAAGTYTGVQGRPAPSGYFGSTVVTQVVYITRSVAIQGGYTTTNWTDPVPEVNVTTLDAKGEGRVLFVGGNISATIEGLRFTGGDAAGLYGNACGSWEGVGGGVFVLSATVTICHSEVWSNTADTGGGLVLYGSTALLTENVVSSNVADGFEGSGGGAHICESSATLSNNDITSNTAEAYGGGIEMYSSNGLLKDNVICGNDVCCGGGLRVCSGSVVIDGNTVRNNTAIDAGGMWLDGGGDWIELGALTLTRNVIVGNTATGYYAYPGDGGGLLMNGGAPLLINNVIVGNQASGAGSGLFIEGASPRLLHTTIASNTGGDASGIHVVRRYTWPGLWASSAVYLTNTILVSQTVGITVTAGSTVTVNGILWYSTPLTAFHAPAATIFIQNQFAGDPAFAANGYHLTVRSAAIDAGVDAGVLTDVDGDTRPFGDLPDLGADETARWQVLLPIALRGY